MENLADSDQTSHASGVELRDAVIACEKHIAGHKRLSGRIPVYLLLLSAMLLGFAFTYAFQADRILAELMSDQRFPVVVYEQVENDKASSVGSFSRLPVEVNIRSIDTYALSVFLVFTITTGVFLAVYRLHLKHIADLERAEIGFFRASLVTPEPGEVLQPEVVSVLLDGAFGGDIRTAPRKSRLENPLPGHPASDLSTAVLNELLDRLEKLSGERSKKEKKRGD